MAGKLAFSPLTQDDQWNNIRTVFANGVIYGYSGVPLSAATAIGAVEPCIIFTKDGLPWVSGSPTNGFNFAASSGGIMHSDGADYKGDGLVQANLSWARIYNNAMTKWIQCSAGVSNSVITVRSTSVYVDEPMGILSVQFNF